MASEQQSTVRRRPYPRIAAEYETAVELFQACPDRKDVDRRRSADPRAQMEDKLPAAKCLFRTAAVFALPLLVTLASRPARADVFDGARKTFQTDIPHFFTQDVPHFFQDDVPCAFGGQPTSGAKRSWASGGPSNDKGAPPKEPPPKGDPGRDSSPTAAQ